MVDCGLMFEDPDKQLLVNEDQVIVPDISFVAANREHLEGIVITHAHEDHIGALPLLWDQLRVPIYTTAFTAEVLRRKCRAKHHRKLVEYIIETDSFEQHQIGGFEVTWIPMTHSTFEGHGLFIKTELGSVFHTGDWKLDSNPGLGRGFESSLLTDIAARQPKAIICDSTNALKSGHSLSERDVAEGLEKLICEQQGRVLVSCFASNIARLVALAKAAQKSKRYLCLLGRSLENMYHITRAVGAWPEGLNIYPAKEIAYLPRNETLIVATGSQGEPRAALARLAQNRHPVLELERGDCVVFSSMRIPGNEPAIDRLVNAFKAQGVDVFEAKNAPHVIHASGHPNQDELETLYRAIKPKLAIPTHGEDAHLQQNAAIAKQCGVARQLTGRNGDLFQISPTSHCSKNFCKTGRMVLENR